MNNGLEGLLECVMGSTFPTRFCLTCLSGSVGNSRSSTQMNSYSDSGYQDASSGYLSNHNHGKAELRMQHSFPGSGAGPLMRNARAEGQAQAQVQPGFRTECFG